ncbi:hypothetical protein [Microbispora corallina]|uniref:hypothetical protein n=1 Tax=Microbispora corallina TaxID=83302 RepID=UPI001950CB02|nr:hypothetical protein [Microbispora corallina]
MFAWLGSELISGVSGFYYDISVIDGIGVYPLAQGLGIGYLGSGALSGMVVVWQAEMLTLALALPAVAVGVAALLRNRWNGRVARVVACALLMLAAVNLMATVVSLWSPLTQCPPAVLDTLPSGYACYMNGGSVRTPPFLYGVAYASAARLLLALGRGRGRRASPAVLPA